MTDEPFRPADILGQVLIQELALSPDGETVFYSRRTIEDGRYRRALWRVPYAGGEPEQLTDGTALDGRPRPSPDGGTLLFLSDRSGRAEPWLLPLAGGEPRPVAGAPAGTHAAEWSADGATLVLLAPSGEERFRVGDPDDPVARRIVDLNWRLDGVGVRDQFTSAWTMPAAGGAATRLGEARYEVFQALPLADGGVAVVADMRPGAQLDELPELWALDAGGGPRRLAALGGSVTVAACSPGGRLALVGAERPHAPHWARQAAYAVEADGPRRLAPDLDRSTTNSTFGDVVDPDAMFSTALAWLDEEHVVALVGDGGRALPYALGLDGSAAPLAGGELVCSAIAAAAGRVAVVASDGCRPGEVYAVEDGAVRPLTTHGSAWLARSRRDPERVRVPHPDGHAVDAWLLRARGADGPAPLVLQIHGGPHGAHGPTPWLEMLALADAGIGVLYANPRGSVGYGEDFASCIHGEWGEKDVSDLLAVLDWAVAEGHADPARIGLLGLSYGGWMTGWLAGRHPERFAAAVAENPVSDMVSFFGSSDIGWQTDARLFGFGTLPDDADEFLRRSPFREIHRTRAPLLLLHAEGDLRCPVGQSELLFAILRARGLPVELVRYPGGSHILGLNGRPDRRVDRAERIVDWFRRHLA